MTFIVCGVLTIASTNPGRSISTNSSKTKQKETEQQTAGKRKLSRTFLDDLESPDLSQSFKRDLTDLYDFYLDTDYRDRLESMNPVSRTFHITFWIVREMFLRLTPVRRLMLVIGLFLSIAAFNGPVGQSIFALMLIMTVLILELKDKLLAQNELETGRAVQLALMPDPTPEISGWDIWLYSRPANEVGGDLVDHLSVGGGRLGISLGDVAGKGLGAAMYMAKLQATIRALAPAGESLSTLAEKINTIFRRDGVPSRFASLLYLEIDDSSNKVEIMNAGHLPAIHKSRDGLHACPYNAPAIGLMDNPRFHETAIDMISGDFLVIYSDGVTEARSTSGTFFGDSRLALIIERGTGKSAQELGRDIIFAVDEFAGESRQNDDVSLIVLRRR